MCQPHHIITCLSKIPELNYDATKKPLRHHPLPPPHPAESRRKVTWFLFLNCSGLWISPEPVIVNILSRLPVKTIIHCKCVCKKWQNIVLDSYFADLHLSRSPASFMIYQYSEEQEEEMTRSFEAGVLKWVEVEDELDHHTLHHDPVMSLDLNLAPIFQKTRISPMGLANGLICLRQFGIKNENIYICNPITREYMILPKQQYSRQVSTNIAYCFGFSSTTREYKVIRIFQKYTTNYTKTLGPHVTLSEAEVYTLGTGQWRSLGHVPYWINECRGQFLKGNAHWTLVYTNLRETLCAFDFDKETFEFFPSPPCEDLEESFGEAMGQSLGVLKGCLIRCNSYEFGLNVWVMKEYGIKNSWHKEFVIKYSISPDLDLEIDVDIDLLDVEPAFLIEGFKDGTFLMRTFGGKLIVYCPRRKTIVDTEIFDGCLKGFAYHPSFHRLHNFENERVHVF